MIYPNLFLLFALVLLHGPDGHEVRINPDQIVAMHSKKSDAVDRKLFVPGAECLLNTADGKFIAVVEPCDTIRKSLESMR